MPQVPYKPVPDGAPGMIPTPSVRIDAPLDAFGGNVARATEGMGKALEGVGDEMFKRALALQQLANETEAREAESRYMIGAGELHANYNAMQGKAAVDAYPKYIRDLEEMRVNIRGTMSNPASQKMYDGPTMSTMGRTIFNGAGHAASQNKKWAIGTTSSMIELDTKSVEDDPTNDRLFADKQQRVREGIKQLSSLQGFEENGPQQTVLELKATSKMWSQRIIGLSRTKPFEAATMLDKYGTSMTEDDRLRTDTAVRGQARAVGSVNIANQVYDAGAGSETKPAKPLADMEAEARAKAEKIAPNDPILAQHAITALRTRYNQDKHAKRQESLTNRQVVDKAILSGVKTEQELRADPVVAGAIDALPEKERLAIPGQINRYNAARDQKTNQDTYDMLWGRSNNDVEGFLNTDMTKEKLSPADMRKLQARQEKFKEKAEADPRVDRAIGQLRGAMGAQLEALGIFRRDKNNKDQYDQFTGAVQSAIDVWTENKGKPPTYQEMVNDIGPQIIRQRSEPGSVFGSMWPTKRPAYDQDVPPKFTEALKADILAKGGDEPTKEQISKAYLRMQFIKLYGSKKDQGKVP